jgi:hypothetical protein
MRCRRWTSGEAHLRPPEQFGGGSAVTRGRRHITANAPNARRPADSAHLTHI